jgi:hypothetical protein
MSCWGGMVEAEKLAGTLVRCGARGSEQQQQQLQAQRRPTRDGIGDGPLPAVDTFLLRSQHGNGSQVVVC